MRFCPQCGERVLPGARFCVGCGESLGADAVRPAARRLRVPGVFVAAFAAIALGGVAIALITLRPESKTAKSGAPESKEGELPPGHPKIQLPAEARKLIDDLQAEAERQPANLTAWSKLGEATFRASLFDPSYHDRALAAYGHVLEREPDNLGALRAVGNINYDRRKYDQAIAAYEHYLKIKSDDPEVRTDLGTMYLYTGNAPEAVAQYKKAIAAKPDLYEGYFNMGVAYGAQRDETRSREAFEKALSLARDDEEKARVKEMLAKLGGTGATQETQASGARTRAAASFEDEIERTVRDLPIAGPKVKSIQWASRNKGKVLMDNFPMDLMPEFARKKFLQDLNDGIQRAKKAHSINATVVLEIADSASGKVMETVRQ